MSLPQGHNEDMVAKVRSVREVLIPAGVCDIVPHFSCKNNAKNTVMRLKQLCRECHSGSVLLVSGSGKVHRMDTIGVLRALAAAGYQGKLTP